MFTIIAGAIVSLLIFFFERWWTANHPIADAKAKAAFMTEVARPKHFWMGSRRHAMASALFDKYAAKLNADPPVVNTSTAGLNSADAKALAGRYALGLTLDPSEVSA